MQIDITQVNDAPVNTVPATLHQWQKRPARHLTGISVADVDAGDADITTRLQVSDGVLNVALGGGASISAGTNDSADITLSGSVSQINAALASLSYTGDTDVVGPAADGLIITTDDGGNSGGGEQIDSDTVQIDITQVNDAPINTVPATLTVSEETSTTLGGISVADVDAGDADITTRLQVTNGILNIAPGSANISAGANDSSDITLSGSVSQINAALASLRYTGDTDVVGTAADALIITTDDGGNSGGGNQIDSDTVQIDITQVNDAPVQASIEGTALAYTENGDPVTLTSTLTITDVDDDNFESAVVAITGNYAAGEDVLAFVNQNNISGSWDPVAGKLTLSGSATLAQYEAAVQSVTYINTSNDPSDAMRTVSFTVSDGDSESNTQTRDINITAVNDAPATTVPATVTVAEETSTTLTGVSVADVDAVDGDITTRLQVTDGILNITPGSANIITGTNNSADITLSGSVSEINATLASLNYTGNTDVTGTAADTLTITTNDNGNTGSGGALIDSASIQIDIIAVNDSPVVTAPVDAYEVDEQSSLAIHGTGFTVSDADAANDILSATLTVEEGTLSVVGGNSGISISSGNASESVVLTGTLTQIDNLLTRRE